MIRNLLNVVAILLIIFALSSCSGNGTSGAASVESYDVELNIVGVEEDDMLTLKESDYTMLFKKDGDEDQYEMEMPLTIKISEKAIDKKVQCTSLRFFLANDNGMSVEGASIELSAGNESDKKVLDEINNAIVSGEKELAIVVTKIYDGEDVSNMKQWGLSRLHLSYRIEQQSGDMVIGPNNSYDIDYMVAEAYKKGFADGCRGISGWNAVGSFDRWLDMMLGVPENKEQKESRKKYKEQIRDSYNSGLHEGLAP